MVEISKLDAERVIGRGQTDRRSGRVETPEQAVRFLEECLHVAVTKRLACDIAVPDGSETQREQQRRAFQAYLLTVGRSMGAAEALFRAGLIEERAWREFHQKSLNTLMYSIVGAI